ncbi:MAG: hypothetical protein HY858_07520 [Candidatus Solibacter usitatus]|nr:hypothetical protein [Candidatus Solibacter usitatus]
MGTPTSRYRGNLPGLTARLLCLLLAASQSAPAWDTAAHRLITRAALDSLPQRYRARLGPEAANLIDHHSTLPDRYAEMTQFGFVRGSPGVQSVEEAAPFCLRPDGEPIHSATFERDEDLGSLIFLFERVASSLGKRDAASAARYMGTLAHFIADSLSPAHAGLGQDLARFHQALEAAPPSFSLGARAPRTLGRGLVAPANTLLDRIGAVADVNRSELPTLVKALSEGDEKPAAAARARAARAAAELLADALAAVFVLGEG